MKVINFANRREKLQSLMAERGFAGAIFSDRLDQYYFSGTMQSNYLVVPVRGEAFHLTRKALERVERESGMSADLFRGTREIIGSLTSRGVDLAGKMGLNLEGITAANFLRWQNILPEAGWADIGDAVRSIRRIKDDSEQAAQRFAGQVMAAIPDWVEAAIRQGKTNELVLGATVEFQLRLAGQGPIRLNHGEMEVGIGVVSGGVSTLSGSRFEGVCAGAGIHPANPNGPSDREIQPGEPITMDYSMNYQGYQVDMTRMISFGQEPPTEALRAYDDMLAILIMLEEKLTPGVRPCDLFALAEDEAARRGWSENFMGYGTEKVRFVGHGIGLTLDEEPYLAPKMEEPLEAGMVVALEPKVMLPGIGVVGPEDTYIIGSNRAERITRADREWRVVK